MVIYEAFTESVLTRVGMELSIGTTGEISEIANAIPHVQGSENQTTSKSAAATYHSGLAPRVRRMTSEFSRFNCAIFNPKAPEANRVRRFILWCTFFSCGLFTSLLLMVAISLTTAPRAVDITRLSDVQLLTQVGASELLKENRVKALEEIGRRGLTELKNTPMLFDGPEISIAFAKASAQIGELALVPALMKQLDDSNPQVRSASAQALGVLGDRRTSEFLSLRAARETDPAVREKMKAAIGALGGPALGTTLVVAPLGAQQPKVSRVR